MTSQDPAEDNAVPDKLYAAPLSTGVLQLPGPTYESAQSLLEVLRRQHQIFYIEDGKKHHEYACDRV